MNSQLLVTNQKEIFVSFVITQIISAFVGFSLSGLIGYLVGGYSSSKSPYIVFIIQVTSTFIGVFIPYITTLKMLTIVVFFFDTIAFLPAPFQINLCFDAAPKKYAGITGDI